MNKLVIIGNGFDLTHKLPTSYKDFLTWYLKKVYKKFSINGYYQDALLKLNSQQGSEIKFNIDLYTLPQIITLLKNRPDKIETLVRVEFFERLLDNAEANWVDIEGVYFDSLINTYNSYHDTLYETKHELVKQVKFINEGLSTIKLELEEYLKTINYDERLVFPSILDKIEEFIKEKNFNDIITKQTTKTIFLNFNYTGLIALYAKHLDTYIKYEIINIHGQLDEQRDSIIFGYGDDIDDNYQLLEKANVNELTTNFKLFDYFKTSNYKNLSNFINLNDYEVAIFGHSCGLSDRLLLNKIFENGHCKAIKIYYYKNGSENDHFTKTQEISRHFSKNNKGKMLDLVVPFDKSEPLL